MDAVLVGCVLPGVENHSLGALQAAVAAESKSSRVVPFAGLADVRGALREIMALAPRVCGISIQSSEAALASLVLARMLRQAGYAGHIVCGGHFATLNAEEILRSAAGVDSVVRFSGERAFAALARGARNDDELSTLPGLVFRDASGAIRRGAPGRPLGEAPPRLPARALDTHLGLVAADLVTSHGCEARCAYCCVAATSELAARELEAAGDATPAYARRPLALLVAEIAELHRTQGARVFNFMDDNLLPLEPEAAKAWLLEFEAALARLGVGKIAFSLQLRADVVTREIAELLARVGLVRAYVGIDATSSGQLRALGRKAEARAGRLALVELSRVGVYAVCNALLIGPTFRFESVLAEIEALADIDLAPVHLLPIDVRAGTAYARRAESRGLAEGSFLFRRFRFEDPRVAELGRVVVSLPTRLEERSVPIGLYDLGYNLGIARRLLPELRPLVERLSELYVSLARAWNLDQVRVLRLAAAAAATERAADVTSLIAGERAQVEAHDRALLAECDRAIVELERAASRALRRPVRAHARGRLLSVAVSLGLAACGLSTRHDDREASAGGAAGDGTAAGARGGSGGTNGAGAGGTNGGGSGGTSGANFGGTGNVIIIIDAGPPPIQDAGNDGYIAVDSSSPCDTYGVTDLPRRGSLLLPDAGDDAGVCPDGTPGKNEADFRSCVPDFCCPCSVVLRFDQNGVIESARAPETGAPLDRSIADCITALLGNSCYPSLACEEATVSSHCWVA